MSTHSTAKSSPISVKTFAHSTLGLCTLTVRRNGNDMHGRNPYSYELTFSPIKALKGIFIQDNGYNCNRSISLDSDTLVPYRCHIRMEDIPMWLTTNRIYTTNEDDMRTALAKASIYVSRLVDAKKRLKVAEGVVKDEIEAQDEKVKDIAFSIVEDNSIDSEVKDLLEAKKKCKNQEKIIDKEIARLQKL